MSLLHLAWIVLLLASSGTARAEPEPSLPASPAEAAPYPPEVVPIAPPAPPLPARLALRTRELGHHLDALAARGGGRVAGGIVQLALGATFVTLGAVLDNYVARSLLLLVGSGTIAHGTFQLALQPDASEPARRFRHHLVLSVADAEARVRAGEGELAALARGARRARIADGSVAMAVASAYVPLLWWLQRRQDPSYRFGDATFDYVGLAISGINFASGLVTALVRSDAERRLDEYRALSERLERDAAGGVVLGLVGAPGGLVGAARVRF